MKQDLRIVITKKMIKKSLIQLLKTKPVNKIKINELCEAAGVNRATFYRHYKTMQDVLHEIETDFVKQIPSLEHPPQNREEAYTHIEAVCTYIYNHSDILKLLFLNTAETDIIQGLKEFYEDFLHLQKDYLPIKEPDEDTISIIIALVGGGCQSLVRKWILDDIPKSPQEIASILCNMLCWSSNFKL